LASIVRSGIPYRVSSGGSESRAAAFPPWLRPPLWSWWGLQGRWRRRHYRGSGSTVSPSALGLRVVGLPRTPPMILTQLRRIFGGLPGARMPLACGPRGLHFSFRDRERELSPLHAVRNLRVLAMLAHRQHLHARAWGSLVSNRPVTPGRTRQTARPEPEARTPLLGFSKDAPPSRS
jgi:hypothetical protein